MQRQHAQDLRQRRRARPQLRARAGSTCEPSGITAHCRGKGTTCSVPLGASAALPAATASRSSPASTARKPRKIAASSTSAASVPPPGGSGYSCALGSDCNPPPATRRPARATLNSLLQQGQVRHVRLRRARLQRLHRRRHQRRPLHRDQDLIPRVANAPTANSGATAPEHRLPQPITRDSAGPPGHRRRAPRAFGLPREQRYRIERESRSLQLPPQRKRLAHSSSMRASSVT